MEELGENFLQIINRAKKCEAEWENEIKLMQIKMQEVLFGSSASTVSQTLLVSAATAAVAASSAASPQQMKKRPKRLSSVVDGDEESDDSQRLSLKSIANEIEAVVNETEIIEPELTEAKQEPEPEHIFARPTRAAKLKADNFKEPLINAKMRRPDNFNETARKIKKESETRPSQIVSKKSTKSNKSQIEVDESMSKSSNSSISSNKKTVDESLVVVAEKEAPVVDIMSEEDDTSSTASVVSKKKSKKDNSKNAVVKIKKEKLSTSSKVDENEQTPQIVVVPLIVPVVVPKPTQEILIANLKNETTTTTEESLQTTTTTNTDTTNTDTTTTDTSSNGKRTRKKKPFNHRPIKEERISLAPDSIPTPVSTRTRSGSSAAQPRPASVYEDAVDKMPQEEVAPRQVENEKTVEATPKKSLPKIASPGTVVNETIATNNATMVTACDATFVSNQVNSTFAMPPQGTFNLGNNPNATVTISNDVTKNPILNMGDATFDVRTPPQNDSIMTEDDSFDKPLVPPKKIQPPPPPPQSAKVLKTKSKGNELFNPCVQSPVKKKVEAFENHAQKATGDSTLKTKSKKTKENSEPELPSVRDLKSSSMATTPVIGKPHAPALGRFLTPTQQSNVTPNACNAKKLPNSASKAMPFPLSKQNSASNLKCTNSTSSQSLSRENSEDELKKGFNKLQKLADERKKKRELKHQQAAQLREAKEKERSERLKKLVKEREEKARKKALELEQKKRELEEINRNLKLQEEKEQKQRAATAATSKSKVDPTEIARQERELLEQMRKMPPPAKQNIKYNFNMLQSDDSTDEEGKASYKRPKPPQWSRSSVRADSITCQAYCSSDVIDSLFSVQPMTPDLKAIFPNIDARYLKRNSSAIWRTPPRYSEMPKY